MKSRFIVFGFFALMIVLVSSGYIQQSAEQLYQSGIYKEEVEGELEKAIEIYDRIIKDFPENESIAAKALYHIGQCYEKLGKKEAQKAYQRLIDEYPGQKKEVAMAKERLARLTEAMEKVPHKSTFRKLRIPTKLSWTMQLSPDGKTIVFSGQTKKDTSWHWQIWALPVDGGKPKQLTQTPASVLNGFPCWSPDGKTIAYVRARADKNYFKGFGEVNIYTIPVNGGDSKALTSDSDSVKFCPIAWSPNGKLIAYFSTDEENSRSGILKILSVNDGVSRVVGKIQLAHVHIELAWSPDSKRIAFNYGPETYGKDIRVISINDGSFVDIKTGLVDINIFHLDWSPNGDRFVFSGYQGDSPEFWLMEDFLPLVKGRK